jgi:hypothetical protein
LAGEDGGGGGITWYHPLTPRGFLQWGGIVLILLGVVGFFGIFSEAAFPTFWLDDGENWAHFLIGIIALAALYVPFLAGFLAPYYKWIVVLVGLIALFFGVYGFILPLGSSALPNAFGISNLESPLDNLFHLAVAVWAFWAAFYPVDQEVMA